MHKFKLFLLVCTLLFSALANAAEDRAFFWKVSSQKTSLYLFGSIHFANDSFYPLRDVIIRGFDDSDYLVVEVDLGKIVPAEYVSLMQRYGRNPQGVSIADLLTDDTYQRLRKMLQLYGLPENSMDAVRPGVAVADLSSMVMLRSGFVPDKGIDMSLLRRAQSAGKPVLSLETMEQQVRMFSVLPQPELLMRETLEQAENVKREIRRLEKYWKSGDDKALMDMLIHEPETKNAAYREINEVLLYSRNRNMFRKIQAYLETDDTYFVVVGAAHLPGEQGLVEMLENAGYKVERK